MFGQSVDSAETTLVAHDTKRDDEMNAPPGRGSSGKGWLSRAGNWLQLNFIQLLVSSKNPPWFDARGVSLGLFIGFLVPVGGQLAALALLRFLFRFNYILAAGFTLVSNPFNMIPLYYGYYCLGSLILHRPIMLEFERFDILMCPVMSKTYFWEALPAFVDLGREILLRWSVAAVVLAVVSGAFSYLVALRLQHNRLGAETREPASIGDTFSIRLDESRSWKQTAKCVFMLPCKRTRTRISLMLVAHSYVPESGRR